MNAIKCNYRTAEKLPRSERALRARSLRGSQMRFTVRNLADAIFDYMKCYDRWWTEAKGDVLMLIKSNQQARQEIEQGLASIFLAMRRDLRSTNVSNNVSKNYMQFYNCGLLNPFDSPSNDKAETKS